MEEVCYLKRLRYYSLCLSCKGTDENPCYNSKTDVQEDIGLIHHLRAETLEMVCDEELFDFKNNFGMGMEKW